MGSTRGVALLLALVLVAGCSGSPDDAGPATQSPAPPSAPSVEGPGPTASEGPPPTSGDATTAPAERAAQPGVLASHLQSPWGLDLLPDGDALVTERDTGEVLRVSPDGQVSTVGTVPGVVFGGEGGLLGIAVAPDVAESGAVFVYLTSAEDNRVLRMRLADGALAADEVVLAGIPRASNHNGGRLAFGPDGFLYVTTGDAQERGSSQDPGSLGGKILRIDADGDPAPGNPTAGSPVWSTGHRNVQGIGWDADGRMYASEFGQNTYDELNLIEPGGNYGWPEVEGAGGDGRFVDPLLQWDPSDASPSGIAVTDDAVYLAALAGESLWRVPLTGGGTVGEPERLLRSEYGRLRAVEVDAAGRLWVLTSNISRGTPGPDDDRLVVVDPAELG